LPLDRRASSLRLHLGRPNSHAASAGCAASPGGEYCRSPGRDAHIVNVNA
jgi:hypothetical protein